MNYKITKFLLYNGHTIIKITVNETIVLKDQSIWTKNCSCLITFIIIIYTMDNDFSFWCSMNLTSIQKSYINLYTNNIKYTSSNIYYNEMHK